LIEMGYSAASQEGTASADAALAQALAPARTGARPPRRSCDGGGKSADGRCWRCDQGRRRHNRVAAAIGAVIGATGPAADAIAADPPCDRTRRRHDRGAAITTGAVIGATESTLSATGSTLGAIGPPPMRSAADPPATGTADRAIRADPPATGA
jgi:hypothetical protein